MCGIAGYKKFKPVEKSVLLRMTDALYHRGPDSEGFYFSPIYSAGMRRLSINDLVTGDQPLYNEDKSVVLFYNGEIYNSLHLKKKLTSQGHRFRTQTDGEVICHLYSEYGEGLFEKLDGMFAVALWIKAEKKLILARDIPGEKPLYYTILSKNEVVFASEIKSIIKYPALDLTLNYQALWDFPTFLWIPEPETVYKSIMALPRGHLLVADTKGIRIQPYIISLNQQRIEITDDAVIKETARVVTEAVSSRLLSDVPVGCFLSGGIDSSIVAALAARSLDRLDTFTIGFENVVDPYHGIADEAPHAEEFAKKIGSKHHTIRVTANDFRRDLITFCTHGDQPFSVSSGLGILSIARAAHEQGIKVLLSGDGADECFGGYSWYSCLGNNNRKEKTQCNNDSEVSFQNFGLDLESRLVVLNKYTAPKRAWAWHYYASESEKTKLYHRKTFESAKTSLRHFHNFKKNDNWSAEDFIKQDREFYFPNEMLRKIDRMTMAFSVEGRAPFAAPSVLAHADKLRYSHMVQGNTLKWALRKAFAHILPEEICNRPKHGFNVPIDHWLNHEWRDLVEEAFSPNSNLMNAGLIHQKSRDIAISMLQDKARLNGHTIFSFIILNLWLEMR